jgi:hypothetical protein
MFVLAFTVFITIFTVSREIAIFSQNLGFSVNAIGILPHLYNNRFYRLFIQFGIVLLFCNAPFATANSNFIIIRTGYKKWFAGQALYILIASFLYTVFVFGATLIPVISNLTFQTTWGEVFSTLAQISNNVSLQIQFGLQLKYDVADAFLHTFFLLFLFSFMVGLLIFFMNSFINRISGIIAATTLILVALVPEWTQYPMQIRKISPGSLTQIMQLDNQGVTEYPSIKYAYAFLVLVSAFLLLLTFLTITFKIRPYKKFKENAGGLTHD